MGYHRFMSDPNQNLDNVSFIELLGQARGGDEHALGNLLQNHRNYLLLIANKELDIEIAGKLGASDVVQESMLKAYKGFEAFEGESKPQLLAWLRKILQNDLNHARRSFKTAKKRSVTNERALQVNSSLEYPLVDPQLTPQSNAVVLEQSARLNNALSQLPDDYQQAIQLRSFQGLSFEDVGLKMKRTADASRKLWTRAILKLQETIDSKEN